MGAIVSIRSDAKPDPHAEFERALATFGRESSGGYSTALEDIVYFGHAMMSADAARGEPLLLAALRHPRAAEFADHIRYRLSAKGAMAELRDVLPRAITPERERFALWMLDECARAYPFPKSFFEEVVAQSPSTRIRDAAARALRTAR